MPISGPRKMRSRGLVFDVRGRPGQRRTAIALLLQGPWAATMRRTPGLRRQIVQDVSRRLRAGAPVDTGKLRASIHYSVIGRGPMAVLGPQPYDRRKMKNPGVRRRRPGRPKLARFYALPANVTSRRKGYVDRAVYRAAAKAQRPLQQAQTMQRNIRRAQTMAGPTGIIGRVAKR